MVEYHCKICSFTTIRKAHYERHLQTKKHLSKEKQNEKDKDKICTQNAPNMHPEMHPDAPNMHPDAPKSIDNKTCEFCQKRFTRTTGLKKHLQICSQRNIDQKSNLGLISNNLGSISTNQGSISTNKGSISNSVINLENIYICSYCKLNLSSKSNLTRHYKSCKKIRPIEKSGLYCMWNEKMIDDEGINYYKLGRTSSRESRISSYAHQYGLPKSKIKFLYEVEFKDEVFAERFLFYLLDKFRIYKNQELFKISFELLKKTIDELKEMLCNINVKHNNGIILDNFELLMNVELDDVEENNEDIEEKKYLLSIINGDYEIIEKTKEIKVKNNLNKIHKCQFCNKIFTTRQGKSKHLQTCKVKKKKEEEENNNMQIEILKKEVKELKEELKENKGTIINNNHNNNNYNTINYLNLNFQNMQTIEDFLEKLKNKYKLSISDRKCLLNTFNECGIDAFAETFSIIMKKYQSEQVEKGLLPTMPIVCTDGNLRSMKEYHENGWQTTYSDSNIDKMINISNDQIYESENTMVFLKSKDRKKIHNRIKKDNTLINLEEIKKNYVSKTGDIVNLELYENSIIKDEKDIPEFLNTNQDFSIIDDDYIEKYSKL